MKNMTLAFSLCCLLGVSALWAQLAASEPLYGATGSTPSGATHSDAPAVLIKPTSGTPQSATPRAVCTFQCIGLYWTPDGGADDKPCRVRYRPAGEQTWHEALPLWFDQRIGEYRGSIVQLCSGTT